MAIDWLAFTPWSALAGGVLIGLGAGLFAVVNGRIAGISGLLGSMLQRGGEGRREKLAFLLGLLAAPFAGGYLPRCRQPVSPRHPGHSSRRAFW